MVFLFAIIPFRLLYFISNGVAFLLRKVVKYRLNTVKHNLDLVYPELTKIEKHLLIREIYRNLTDILLEGIKGFSMSKKQLMYRHKLMDSEPLETAYELNKSVMLVTGHYGNWEWGAFSPNYFIDQQVIGFYKPLTNKYINNFALKKRAFTGTILADINDTSLYFEKYHDRNSLFLMAADQSPTKPHYAVWLNFLGQKTACIHGIEKYVDQYDLAVLYCHIKRVKRGYYELHVDWITHPSDAKKQYGETTALFMKKLEKQILNKPQDWLWTHNRWKHRPEATQK